MGKRYPRGLTIKSTDSNHAEIMTAGRDVGAEMLDTHVIGRGFPDAICVFRDQFWLLEIKTEDGELTPAEKRFALKCKVKVRIVRSAGQFLRLIGAIE